MRQLISVALMAVMVAVPAGAQHGGGGHVGGGGFASRGAGGGRMGGVAGGFARPVMRGGGGVGVGYAGRGQVFGGRLGVAAGRPGFYHREGERRRGSGGGAGYGDYGWLVANDPDYGSEFEPVDGDGYEAGSTGDGSYAFGPSQDPGVEEGDGPGAQGYSELRAAGGELPVPYRTSAGVQRSPVAQPSLYNCDAVTLVFKDGRAPEKIHNYALTRTTLYVTDGRRREIPVASLDWAATEKVNRAAGVRFDLPVLR
jgi:hypothetical protein